MENLLNYNQPKETSVVYELIPCMVNCQNLTDKLDCPPYVATYSMSNKFRLMSINCSPCIGGGAQRVLNENECHSVCKSQEHNLWKHIVSHPNTAMSWAIKLDWVTCIYKYKKISRRNVPTPTSKILIKQVVIVEACAICKKQYTHVFFNLSTGNISPSLTSWRSGMNTGLLMTWWLKYWSLLVLLFGLARTMMEMSSQIFWLKVGVGYTNLHLFK